LDAYAILSVARDASVYEIRVAYRALARRHHPDRPDGDESLFLQIQAAYQILIDPGSRAAHDRDPERSMAQRTAVERRRAQLSRRKNRLRKLYD
jgi:DnaJ-class molecular chaperone